MKKQMSLFIWAAAVFGMSPVLAATNIGTRAASSADLSGAPAVRARDNVNYEKYQTRSTTTTYQSRDAGDLYYTQPASRSALYKQYDSNTRSGTATTTTTRNVRTTRAETVRSTLKRKYYLAHPFFQPLKGKFGSVTDVSYNTNSYDMTLTPAEGMEISDTKATWDMKGFSIKEDFSYGITDRLAVLVMGQYDSYKYKFDWSVAPDDKMDDNGLNLYGAGVQWRFVDNEKWIGTLSGYFQHQKDISNNYVLDLKGGYKVARSTIYALARGWYVDFDGNSYGNGIEGTTAEGNKAAIFIAYDTDADNTFYIEGGIGVFSVLDEDWTLNLEAVFGDYDWHNQASIKGAIGWQPNDWVALNLYAKTSFYDSADDKSLGYWSYGAAGADGEFINGWVKHGDAKLSDYKEMTVGLQAVFQF
ncbi:MAG: hypothetical protein K2I81_02075 [Alphaproteobacteria bacterium]|nr:hypothetical protein [Alphaproteobacteria bacterium]